MPDIHKITVGVSVQILIQVEFSVPKYNKYYITLIHTLNLPIYQTLFTELFIYT